MNSSKLTRLLAAFTMYFAAFGQEPQAIQITRNGTQSAAKGSDDFFSGSVEIRPVFPAHAVSRVLGGSVTFQPAARTAWHTHPLGQILIITEGVGRIQQWGGPVQEIRSGDVVWIPPGVKHWHGATPATAMTHLAIQEERGGKAVEWMEKVTDEQYRRSSQ